MSSAYISIKLPTNVPGIGYTLKHRNAVEQLIKYYCKKAIGKQDGNGVIFTQQDYNIMCNRAKCHDMDKLVCSLAYPQLTADYFHRMFNGHHEESLIEPNQKNKYDWMEMIFDMESAKYTKPDKQGGGAYSFASQYKQYIMQYLMPYFILFNLNKEDTGFVDSIKSSVNRQYFESDLIDCIVDYIHTTHIHLLDCISRIDDKGYMQLYGGVAPYKKVGQSGVDYQRPNQIAQLSSPVLSREMIHGHLEAELFDMDKLCLIPAGNVNAINQQALGVCKNLVNSKCQR